MKVTKEKIIGKWVVTIHCINRYRQRVDDDPALNRGRRTATDIERLIRSHLNKIKDVSSLPTLKNAYILETQFCARGKKYYLVIPQHIPFMAVTILTEEQYRADKLQDKISY